MIDMSKVLVIGGGAAGMMAAVTAAQNGHQVVLLEKNDKLGKKLFITGKGRCNVTNAADVETLLSNVCSNSRFLYSAFYDFDNQAVMNFFENAGCPLKIERGERVFPVSDHSSDIIGALQRLLKQEGVKVCLNSEVKDILVSSEKKVRGVTLTRGQTIEADSVLVCTGGLSYSSTGSTGDGIVFAKRLGHTIIPTRPSLVPLEIQEDLCRDLMGLSLKNVSLRMMAGKREIYQEQGEMLFTHFGISGPLVLTASCYLSQAYVQQEKWNRKNRDSGSDPAEIKLYLDLKPALSAEQLDKRVLRDFEEQKNKSFKNALGGLFPSKLIPVMVMLSDIDGEKKVHEITKEERKEFVKLIKGLPMTVKGTRSFAEAIITQGGVSVKEINPSTMESRLVQNLFFAGEVLDLDAHTGGFNLQIAWSTAHLAGNSIV